VTIFYLISIYFEY